MGERCPACQGSGRIVKQEWRTAREPDRYETVYETKWTTGPMGQRTAQQVPKTKVIPGKETSKLVTENVTCSRCNGTGVIN
jgi:DnaJ-class molecular chaperone